MTRDPLQFHDENSGSRGNMKVKDERSEKKKKVIYSFSAAGPVTLAPAALSITTSAVDGDDVV